MSPIGAFLASIVHRQILAGLVYLLETLSVIGFLLTRPDWTLVLSGLLIILIGYQLKITAQFITINLELFSLRECPVSESV